MRTLKERFEAALKARGEVACDQGVQTKWTRRFAGLREANGSLVATNPKKFWYVGSAGSLRIGTTRANSSPAHPTVKEALLREGDIVLGEKQ